MKVEGGERGPWARGHQVQVQLFQVWEWRAGTWGAERGRQGVGSGLVPGGGTDGGRGVGMERERQTAIEAPRSWEVARKWRTSTAGRNSAPAPRSWPSRVPQTMAYVSVSIQWMPVASEGGVRAIPRAMQPGLLGSDPGLSVALGMHDVTAHAHSAQRGVFGALYLFFHFFYARHRVSEETGSGETPTRQH